MGRFLAFDAVFFLMPFAVYAAWLAITRGSFRNIDDWQARTIAYLAIAGAALLLVAIAAFTSFRAIPPGGVYAPAHIEDGRIVPGRVEEDGGGAS